MERKGRFIKYSGDGRQSSSGEQLEAQSLAFLVKVAT